VDNIRFDRDGSYLQGHSRKKDLLIDGLSTQIEIIEIGLSQICHRKTFGKRSQIASILVINNARRRYAMRIMAFGKKLSGDLLFKAVDEQEFVHTLAAALARNAPALQALADKTSRGVTFRGEIGRRVKDVGDPRQAGWTILVAKEDPRRSEIIEVLKPLALHRGMEDPAAPLVFGGESEDAWGEWLEDNYYARELEGKKVPHYVLMVGGPDVLPFRLQSLMDAVANVGRLDFESTDELERYVQKVIRLETAPDPVVKREVILFAPDGGTNDPTYFSREYMVKPLNDHVKLQLNFKTTALMGVDATKNKLVKAMQGAQPALVYTASHGLGLTGELIDQQKKYNGAICCQGRGQLTMEDLFCADDVPANEPFLEGAVFFQFACFGYGTPAQSDYTHWIPEKGMIPQKYADADFIAALPKRLLAHPRGPIAYVGHLDTAFLHGFTDQNDPYIMDRWHSRIQPFVHAVDQLLEVQPSGLAMEDMNRKYSVSNIILNSVYDRIQRGAFKWTPEAEKRFLDTWIIRSDAKNYMVFGDPAARLRIPE
jgi:hypothetical protein